MVVSFLADLRRSSPCFLLALAGSVGLAPNLEASPDRSAPASVIYSSPVPNARYVRPETQLILRFDRAVDPFAPGFTVTVSGSRSGPHPGRVRLVEEGRTLLFQPERRFEAGERVRVSLGAALRLRTGGPEERQRLEFTIAAVPPPAAPGRAARAAALRRLAGATISPPDDLGSPDTLPPGFPSLAITRRGNTEPGNLFLTNFVLGAGGPHFLMVLDDAGTPRFHRAMPANCIDFKLQPGGRLSYFDYGASKFFIMDSTCTVVDSIACGDGFTTDPHELLLLPNGHALVMGEDPQVVDMSAVVPLGDPSALVLGLVIQELDADRNVVFQWRSWDHFEITDATHEDLTTANIDYVHANALEVDSDGHLLLSSRHMDEITKIHRGTGEILWRWGGKNNQFVFLDDPLGFSHQHAIRRTPAGTFTLFDNGNYHVPPFSRAVEYELDEGARTARLVWQYRHQPDIYGRAMGYVQRLPGGSTLISWGTGKPDVVEVAPDGTPVMELRLPAGQVTYRAFRREWAPTTGLPVPSPPAAVRLSQNFPNPFRGQTEMTLGLPSAARVRLRVLDLQGRSVHEESDAAPRSAGTHRLVVNLEGRAGGVYFCHVATETGSVTRRIVHLP